MIQLFEPLSLPKDIVHDSLTTENDLHKPDNLFCMENLYQYVFNKLKCLIATRDIYRIAMENVAIND